jgi:hypothetical protein
MQGGEPSGDEHDRNEQSAKRSSIQSRRAARSRMLCLGARPANPHFGLMRLWSERQ